MKYTVKEKLEIAESVVTIIMFVMAVWGSIIAYEEQFWHKLNHVVNHYHEEINKQEKNMSTATKIPKKD
jgi:hypothetical protein